MKKSKLNNVVQAEWYLGFESFVQLKGLRPRSSKSYLGWVKQLMAHYPEESIDSLSSRRVLDFLVHLQNDRKLAGSTLYRDYLERKWRIWGKIKILRAGSDTMVKPGKSSFLVHYRSLAERFRNLLRGGLKTQHPELYQKLTSRQLKSLSSATTWNVQLQHVGAGRTALRYLARYVKRSGFTNQRLIGYDSSRTGILLRWTPSGSQQSRVLRLSIEEFIRRWLLHVLPKGFARIRHYGYLSSAAKKTRLRVRLLLGGTLYHSVIQKRLMAE